MSTTTRTLRIAIAGPSPCHLCTANCCRQNGHAFAAILNETEARRFAAFSLSVVFDRNGSQVTERVLPYVDGRCQFLGEDDRCTIYDDRPQACRIFECVPHFAAEGVGKHGIFLQRNPTVLRLLQDYR